MAFFLVTAGTAFSAPVPPAKNLKQSRYGPYHTSGVQGAANKAYSPFEEHQRAQSQSQKSNDYLKGRLLIKVTPAFKALKVEKQKKILAPHGVVHHERIFPRARPPQAGAMVVSPKGKRTPVPDLTRWYRLKIPETADIPALMEKLQQDPNIVAVEPDYARRPIGFPASGTAIPQATAISQSVSFGDPYYTQQWHLNGARVQEAWDYLESQGKPAGGSRDIVVAVIDTGVDFAHLDLAANMWVNSREIPGNGLDDDGNGYTDDVNGIDCVTNSGNVQDEHGHGTHVAGIIAAQAGNGLGGVGVAFNVQIMAIKAAQYSGVLAASDIAQGIYYAVENGADVINMSFGGYGRSQVEEDALTVAFGTAVLVAAAGNDGNPNLPYIYGKDMYPAAYNWVLGVMAHGQDNYLASWSNCDFAAQDSHEYELSAPGVGILSTLPGGQYAAWSGTSMAAPVVSGVAALVRTQFPDKNTYSSRFIMGQVAANGSQISCPENLKQKMNRDRIYVGLDAYAALSNTPKPSLTYLEHWLFDKSDLDPVNNDNGRVDAGETIDLAMVVRNHWGKADLVSVTLEPLAEGASQPDPYVTMITGSVEYGAIGSFGRDDNGLVYDEQGVVTGVSSPFRFQVSPDTPNNHVIPFKVTMTAKNGLDPVGDPTVYTTISRFTLTVQRGRELPTIISENLTLTKDYLWIVPGATLVDTGVTLTIAAGARVQFGVANNNPYITLPPGLTVKGTLEAIGTAAEPVELFPYGSYYTNLQNYGGIINVGYARIANPLFGFRYPESGSFMQNPNPINLIDHSYLYYQSNDIYIMPIKIWSQQTSNSIISNFGKLTTDKINIAVYIVGNECGINLGDTDSCLLESNIIGWGNYYPWDLSCRNSVVMPNIDLGSEWILNNRQLENNAFLTKYWDSNINNWIRFRAYKYYVGNEINIANNYWSTTSAQLIDTAIYDYNDDFISSHVIYQPILTTPAASTYPFVVNVALTDSGGQPATKVGAETVTFTVTYNRDMDTTVQPQVSFGPAKPFTDFTIPGNWTNARTWVGTFTITPITGDGYQLIRVAGGRAASDHWLVCGDDAGRFRFEVITSGTEAMNLQASGGEGFVLLMWTQDDFDLLAGFNIYRADSPDGPYVRINAALIPPDQRTFTDPTALPGKTYYYKFTVVKSDMTESGFSNVMAATPIDTIPPAITHTPLTAASPGMPLTILADVTDNVRVQGATLYFRKIGVSSYTIRPMVFTTGNRYTATIEGSLVSSPGLEYYLTAYDGVSTITLGRPEMPYQVAVVDRPIITTVTPAKGPDSGGTPVTIAGSNFKAGASVTFGGAVASNVTVASANQITCTTPAHFPVTVDVGVSNPDGQSGLFLRGFTFESNTASISMPNASGAQHALVQVPVNLANVNGLAAAEVTVTFDSSVLAARGASTGTLTPGWGLAVNTGTPGSVRISMASPAGTVSGSGILANIEFDVVGAPGSQTGLVISSLGLNDGAIVALQANGSFTVHQALSISGAVTFWNGGAGVEGALLTLSGNSVYSGTSGPQGTYSVTGFPAGDYTMAPSKSGGVAGISAYDASLVLQHAAGSASLTGAAATAADVDSSGSITAMDAFYVLQKAVDLLTLPFPGSGVVWKFQPASRSYPGLSGNLTGQDYTAILLGDVSGNWAAEQGILVQSALSLMTPQLDSQVSQFSGATKATLTAAQNPARIQVKMGTPDPAGMVIAEVVLYPNGNEIYSLDLTFAYDDKVATPTAANAGATAVNWLLANNFNEVGKVRLALAGAVPITQNGQVMTLKFQLKNPPQYLSLVPEKAEINEGIKAIFVKDISPAIDLLLLDNNN
jgi:hypothetical protein